MKLVLYSNKSLDTLEDWTLKMFHQIENKDVKIPDLSNPPAYDSWNLGNFYKVIPVKD